MNDKTRKNCEREMRAIWESYRWMIKEKLEELDYMTRAMQREMSPFYIPTWMSEPYINKEFVSLWNEVVEEQSTMYGSNGIRIKEKA